MLGMFRRPHFVPQKQLSVEQAFWLLLSKSTCEEPQVQPEPVPKKIPRELPTISLVKDSFNKMISHVNNFDKVITVRTKFSCQNEGTWGFEHIRGAFEKNVIHFSKTIKEYFQMFDQGLVKEISDMEEVFNQMKTEVEKCFVERNCFEIKEKELLIENERLLEHILDQDKWNNYIDEYTKVLKLETELSKKNDMVENVVYDELYVQELKIVAQLQKKNTTISNLKDHIATFRVKSLSDCVVQVNNTHVTALGMYKLDLPPLSLKLKKNREVHVDCLKQAKAHVDTLRAIVEQARALKRLDDVLDHACKFTTRIHELLVYVNATCSSSSKSTKLVVVTPINKCRQIKSAEPSTSTRVKSSTRASGSQPSGNTKKNRISQNSSSNMKNKA
ncbi:hypothetical protein Tco_1247402 [Tanacetum coccineum]